MGRVLRTALNSEEKVQVIHNGVSLDCLTLPTSQMPDAMPVKSDQPFVLTVARLDPQKGLAYLLSAATCVPGAMFLVAGDGPERGALEAESRRLGLAERVRFLGHREDVPALLRRCDVFVLPSLFEGLPVSVLEAMGAAKPVVATAISGTDEAVVHGETGFLVAAGDPVALAEAIRQLLADPGLARRFGMAGRARVERQFSSETMADRVSEMYGQVLASRRQHATG
jgi:glycosyltransferase involved in cell wall biosynthesis